MIVLIINRKKYENIKNKWSNIVVIEILFLIMFIAWVYIRSFAVPIDSSTEKFMNYAFINRLMLSDYLPAKDVWLSGNTINYYYYGHYITAFLSKISTTEAAETYNLMLALLASLLFVLPYSIGKNLGNNLIKNSTKKSAKIIAVCIGIARM